MESIKTDPQSIVRRLVKVTPEQLIEMGQRLRQWSMDQASPGDTVILEFTDSVSFIWHPPKEYQRNAAGN